LWWSLFQRWILFCLVALLLVRRVWRYFHEVEDDDDFADHLATLAVAYRWVFPVYLALLILVAVAEFFQIGNFFFSLSVLALAFSIRRYYCEADLRITQGAIDSSGHESFVDLAGLDSGPGP